MANKTVKYQGKIYTIDWTGEKDPTKEEFLSLIGEEPKDEGFFSGLSESWEGLKGLGSEFLTAVSPTAKGSSDAANRLVEGVYNPIAKVGSILSETGSDPLSQIAGASRMIQPALEMTGLEPSVESIKEGKYRKAAGQAVIPAIGLAAGGIKPVKALTARARSRNIVPPPLDIAPAPLGPELPPQVGTLQTPRPLVATQDNIIARTPFDEQINPQFNELGYGLQRPKDLTRAEQAALTAEQRAAVEAADTEGRKVKRPVVTNPNIRPTNPIQEAIPNRLREPGMNQVVFQALVPEGLGTRSKYKAPEKITNAAEAVVTEIAKIDERIPISPEQASEITNKITKDSWFRDVYDRGLTRVGTQLNRVSKPLANLVYQTRTEANRLGGNYASQVKKIRKTLSKEENLLAVRILDGTAQFTDVTPGPVKSAVSKIRRITDELGDLAEASGVHIRVGDGELVPFKKRSDYFHHTYPKKFFDDPQTIIDKLMAQGKTAEEAQKLVEKSSIFGERFISPQHAREFNVPGYIEDLSVMERYAYDMSERITQARNFGVKDINDPSSPISQLVNKSKNPEKANRVLREYLGYGIRAPESMHRASQAIIRAEVLTHLSLSAINQLNDLAGVPVRTGFKNFSKGLFDTLTRYGDSTDFATESGALAIMKKEILKDIDQRGAGFAFGISKMEEFVRTVSAVSGRAGIQDIFNKLKKNPTNSRMRDELNRLLDQDVDTVLKQDELTKKQIEFASGRVVELVNSIPDKIDLPPAFTYHNPLVRIPLLFKRFAFTTTKNLVQAVHHNPKRAITAILSYGLMGELTGDAKAAISELTSGEIDSIVDAVSNRDEKSILDTGHPLLNRAIANLQQAWFLGMISDVAEAGMHGSRGVGGLFGGPVFSDIGEGVDATRAAMSGNLEPAKRAVVRRIPFVGQGMANRMKKDTQRPNLVR